MPTKLGVSEVSTPTSAVVPCAKNMTHIAKDMKISYLSGLEAALYRNNPVPV